MIPLLGYVDRLSARPGDTLSFKVSSDSDQAFEASLVRLRCSDPNPEGPGVREEPMPAAFQGLYPSRRQDIALGSYGLVEETGTLASLESFTVSATIWPTLPAKGRQAVVAWGGAQGSGDEPWGFLGLNGQGQVCGELRGQDGQDLELCLSQPLHERRWYKIWLCYDAAEAEMTLGCQPCRRSAGHDAAAVVSTALGKAMPGLAAPLAFAASPSPKAHDHFNGKIERPQVFDSVLQQGAPLADWDFAQEISSTRLVDVGPLGLHGRLVNLPARAMTGANWSGREMCWRHAPEEYGAIHFHDDDIQDAEWETDFTFTVPESQPSGLYGAKLRCGDQEDTIPFIICPPKGKATADLCVIIPTFTYVIYANHARPDFGPAWHERVKDWGAYPHNPSENTYLGLSTYNFHSDGSGICHASQRRPILTLRPGFFSLVDRRGSGLRHFQADTHLLDWLEEKGIAYDVISDHEIHNDGVSALAPYRAVLTSSHPEYHTRETLDAIEAYRDQGGRFVYLGGNGFYWKIALHPEDQGIIEIRRGEGGIRAWAAEPGEYFNAFDGEYGGLWRRNGRPPQQIAGVGFSAQGTFVGSYYKRHPVSYEGRFAWLFQGIEEERLGDFGLSGGGAAGYELDRVDFRLGTPDNVVVLASSEGHSRDYSGDTWDFFVLVPEEHLTHNTTWPGAKQAELIRADMVFYETGHGGAVFSTGSITFCGSLPSNNYDNNISRLLENLVTRFLDPEPFGENTEADHG